MNKDTTRLLQQLRDEMDALRERIAAMETGLDELQRHLETEETVPEPAEAVDLSAVAIGSFSAMGEPVEEVSPQKDSVPLRSTPAPPTPAGVIEDNLSEAGPSPYPRPGVDKTSEGAPLPPVNSPTPEPKPAPKPSLAESPDRYAWRKDMPGLAVRDIRSAIALNDRVLFINVLFQQDAVRFQNALNDLNAFETFPQAEDYLRTNYPQWNYDSEVVYRFMMAVRRKLR